MGANVVASRNCGNWSLCHEQLLVNPPSASRFVSRIQESLHLKFPTDMENFGRNNAVGRLTGLLQSLLGNA